MRKIILISTYLVFALVFKSERCLAQAPAISYTTPHTYTVGTAVNLAPSNTGGAPATNGQTSTFAGSGTGAFADGTGTGASFWTPIGLARDAAGNLYVGDASNNRIRKITLAGVVTTLAGGTAGYADGTGTAAKFLNPYGVALDAAGNVYVADCGNHRIRKITPAGVVTTVAGSGVAGYGDGTGTAAVFHTPTGLTLDAAGNIYVADDLNNMIRKITPSGVVTTIAGNLTAGSANGTGTAASFNRPFDLKFDSYGNLYVTDWYNHMIRKISPSAAVTTLAGSTTAGSANGTGTAASFNYPECLAIDANGNLYVSDEHNNKIRMVTPAGIVTTIAGSGTQGAVNGNGYSATFYYPFGITVDPSGFAYVAEYGNNLIRKVAIAPYTINTALPKGLNFDTGTGVISGAAASTSSATTYSITGYNGFGTSTASLSITVNAAPLAAVGQSLNQNYVITQTPRLSGMTTDSALAANQTDKTKVQTSVQYVDGLGRPIQTVQRQASPLGYDMVQPQAYDQYGRETTKYLPYAPQAGTAGDYNPNALTGDQAAFYTSPPSGSGVSAITDPYSQTGFENSPLSRPVEQGAPGVPWQLSTSNIEGSGHTVKMVYTVNNATSFSTDSVNGRQVAKYYCTINSNGSRALVANGYYTAGTLNVTISKDENWVSGRAGTVEEYKDIDGNVVLKRQYNYTTSVQVLSTYYVYDDLGKLAFVLPPASGADGAGTISQTTLNNLCYQYQYDERGRPIGKKIPGKGWEYTVYNVMDQPVATQDSLQRFNKQWEFTKYDALGRSVQTGVWNNGGVAITRASLQTTLNGISTNLYEAPINSGNGYTNVAWPTSSVTSTLSLNYYDTYANIPGLPSTYIVSSGVSQLTRGLPTVKKTAILNTPANQLWDVMYYDDLGRATQTFAQHYLGGALNNSNYDQTTTTYNFPNQPTAVTRKHWTSATTLNPLVTIANTYYYDHMGRKRSAWEQITNGNSSPTTKTLISKIDYNEIGQVRYKHLHSADSINYLQDIIYYYNERGWLTSSSAPLFAMSLYYNTATNKGYNGNIMYQFWGVPGTYNHHYDYYYDKLNRFTSGVSADGNNEQNIIYDVMGNLTALKRYTTNTLTDQLAYTYTGNQLTSVADATASNTELPAGTTSYTYDGNGNMLTQTNTTNTTLNKTVNTYNLLNLPQSITVPNGTITYTYDATGQKLRKVAVINGITTTTEYIAGIQYKNSTTAVDFIQTEEGRATPITTPYVGYDYTYYLGDNLGNTRRTFGTKTGAAVLYQSDDYYPFGLEINNSVTSPKNEYLYNKKELQEELSEYDYGARFYDPVIGRWNVVDAYAEHPDQIDLSPYAYVGNNPITRDDPDGNCPPCDVPDDDENDFLRYSNQADRNQDYTKALVHDASVHILDFLGVRDLVRAVEHLGDKNVSTTQKVTRVVVAAVNVMPIDGEGTGEKTKIEILPENKIDRNLLNPPDVHGNAPTFKSDGKPVDIHHEGQKAQGPFHERHPDNHRTNGSYKENHPSGQKPLTKAERTQFKKDKKEYWKKEYPKQK